MKNNIQAQLEGVYNTWVTLKNVPQDLSSLVVAGFTKQNIDDALKSLIEVTRAINEDESFEPDMISLGTAQNRLNVLKQYVSTNLHNNPDAHISGLVVNIELLKTNLLEWADLAETRKQKISKSLFQRLGDANVKAQEITTLHTELLNLQEELIVNSQQINEVFGKVTKAEPDFDNSLKTTTTKTAEVTRLEQKAQQDAEKLATQLFDLSNLKGAVDEALKEQKSLFEKFEGYKATVNEILGDANRVGMAGAFIAQRKTYDGPLEKWNKIFMYSIVLLIFMAIWVIAPFMTSGRWIDTLIRLPLSAPAVWLAWFASKQYGHISQLREDYAYKAASAMAFEGYKREAAVSTDPDMQSKLLDTAIKQLGDNPLRIYQSQATEPNDPFNSFMEKHFKDTKLMEAFTNLIKALKS